MNILKQFCIIISLLMFSAYSLAEDAAKTTEKQAEKKVTKKSSSKKSSSKKSSKKVDSKVKELSGISIIGNKEAPKALYIVPWKNSEVGVRSSLTSGLLDDSMRPIDKDVFMRELEFYDLSHSK